MVGLTAEARLACVRSGGKGQASVADRWLKRAFDVVDVLVSSLRTSLPTSLPTFLCSSLFLSTEQINLRRLNEGVSEQML